MSVQTPANQVCYPVRQKHWFLEMIYRRTGVDVVCILHTTFASSNVHAGVMRLWKLMPIGDPASEITFGISIMAWAMMNIRWAIPIGLLAELTPPHTPQQPTIISRSIPPTVFQSECCIWNGELNEYSSRLKYWQTVIKINTRKYTVYRFTYVVVKVLCYKSGGCWFDPS